MSENFSFFIAEEVGAGADYLIAGNFVMINLLRGGDQSGIENTMLKFSDLPFQRSN